MESQSFLSCVSFQRMSALQELQLLEIMCSCFQEQSRDTVRQLMFSALFSLQGNQADESRMALLGKLVSMAIAMGRVPILECAALWLQVRIKKAVCVLTVNSCIDCDLWLCLWCAEDTSCVLRTPGAGAGRRLLQYGTRLCAHVTEYPQRQPTLLLPVYYCCHHPLWPLFRYFGITQNM